MDIYHYNPVTGEFCGMSTADPDPLEQGAFLIPAHSTTLPPPNSEEGYIRRFVDGVWGYSAVDDLDDEPTPEPEPPEPITPNEISRRQFFRALSKASIIRGVLDDDDAQPIITHAETMAALQVGAIPQPIQDIIDAYFEDDLEAKEDAEALVAGATSFYRTNALAELVRAFIGWTPEQQDRFWRLAAQL